MAKKKIVISKGSSSSKERDVKIGKFEGRATRGGVADTKGARTGGRPKKDNR